MKDVFIYFPIPTETIDYEFPSLRPVDTSDPHVTFFYVGDLTSAQFEALVELVTKLFSSVHNLEARFVGLDWFSHPDKTTFTSRITFNKDLVPIRDQIRWFLAIDLGLELVDYSPYVYFPHATLGYYDLGMEWDGPVPRGSFLIDRVVIGSSSVNANIVVASRADGDTKEDEEISKKIHTPPKFKPPRRDIRNNRTDEEKDPDLAGQGADGDRDLSMNYKKIARKNPEVSVEDQQNGSVVPAGNRFRAKNKKGLIKYFDDKESASSYADSTDPSSEVEDSGPDEPNEPETEEVDEGNQPLNSNSKVNKAKWLIADFVGISLNRVDPDNATTMRRATRMSFKAYRNMDKEKKATFVKGLMESMNEFEKDDPEYKKLDGIARGISIASIVDDGAQPFVVNKGKEETLGSKIPQQLVDLIRITDDPLEVFASTDPLHFYKPENRASIVDALNKVQDSSLLEITDSTEVLGSVFAGDSNVSEATKQVIRNFLIQSAEFNMTIGYSYAMASSYGGRPAEAMRIKDFIKGKKNSGVAEYRFKANTENYDKLDSQIKQDLMDFVQAKWDTPDHAFGMVDMVNAVKGKNKEYAKELVSESPDLEKLARLHAKAVKEALDEMAIDPEDRIKHFLDMASPASKAMFVDMKAEEFSDYLAAASSSVR